MQMTAEADISSRFLGGVVIVNTTIRETQVQGRKVENMMYGT